MDHELVVQFPSTPNVHVAVVRDFAARVETRAAGCKQRANRAPLRLKLITENQEVAPRLIEPQARERSEQVCRREVVSAHFGALVGSGIL